MITTRGGSVGRRMQDRVGNAASVAAHDSRVARRAAGRLSIGAAGRGARRIDALGGATRCRARDRRRRAAGAAGAHVRSRIAGSSAAIRACGAAMILIFVVTSDAGSAINLCARTRDARAALADGRAGHLRAVCTYCAAARVRLANALTAAQMEAGAAGNDLASPTGARRSRIRKLCCARVAAAAAVRRVVLQIHAFAVRVVRRGARSARATVLIRRGRARVRARSQAAVVGNDAKRMRIAIDAAVPAISFRRDRCLASVARVVVAVLERRRTVAEGAHVAVVIEPAGRRSVGVRRTGRAATRAADGGILHAHADADALLGAPAATRVGARCRVRFRRIGARLEKARLVS